MAGKDWEMAPRANRSWRRSKRAAAPIIAVVFMVGMTIVAGAVLWTFHVQLPAARVQILYSTVSPFATQAYGDGSDCTNVGAGANQTQICEPLAALDIVVSSFQPAGMPISSLQLYFQCEGTFYLSASVASLEWIPGSTGTVGGGAGTPALGTCGSYSPPSASWNRFMYFDQLIPGSTNLHVGDQFIIFDQGFTPASCAFAPSTQNVCWLSSAQNDLVKASTSFPSTCPSPQYAGGANPATNGSYGLNGCDDDYHGVPTPLCYTVVGACTLDVVDQAQQGSLALSLSMFDLVSPNPG